MTLVIIRDDLVEAGPDDLPTMLQYRTFAAAGSLQNTPPVFNIYVMGEVLKWIQDCGGLQAMDELNREKAGIIYDCLENSRFFRLAADKESASLMNICFNGPTKELEAEFRDLKNEIRNQKKAKGL